MKKILIIRFSSIGDVIQCMSITAGLKRAYPKAKIHWLTRLDMSGMLHTDPDIDTIWEFDRGLGMSGLIKLVVSLRKEKYDLVYDAHYNIRSLVTKLILSSFYFRPIWKGVPKIIIRRKHQCRRFLFFRFHLRKLIEMPFYSVHSFQEPLTKSLGIDFNDLPNKKWQLDESKSREGWRKDMYEFMGNGDKVITIIPSAAWELKRWPVNLWKRLINILPEYRFIIMGGPTDDFCNEIEQVAPERTLNLAGRTSLLGSFYMVSHSKFVISGDTGFLHAADLFRIPGIALMGPTAFGHPSGDSITILETKLPCQPCTKAGNRKCSNKINKYCLVSLSPEMVKKVLLKQLH